MGKEILDRIGEKLIFDIFKTNSEKAGVGLH